MPEKLWTVKQVAALLDIKDGAVYEAVRKGDLACVRIGGIRFTAAQIEAWIARQTRVPVPAPASVRRESEPELRGTGRYH